MTTDWGRIDRERQQTGQRQAPPAANYDLDDRIEPEPEKEHTAPRQERRPAPPPPKYTPPIDRRQMDRFRPAFYLFLGAAFFVLSLISTVAQVGKILEAGGINLAAWQMITAGVAVAAIITAGELMTGEGAIYFCFLIPDVALTVWWLWPVLKNWSAAAGAGEWGAALAGMALGVLSAWIPERVVLGERRRRWQR